MTARPEETVRINRGSFPVSTSILDPIALARVVASDYELSGPLRCQLVSHAMNDVYRIGSGANTHYLRVTPLGWRDRQELEAEVAIIDSLNAKGIHVAAACPRSDGIALTRLDAPEGERLAILFQTAVGEQPEDIDLIQARAFGRFAAALHEAADSLELARPRPAIGVVELLHEPLDAIRDRFSDHPDELAYLALIAARVGDAIAQLPRDAPLYGFCHGDLHPGNVCFDSGGVPTLFDFDLCGSGWRIYDLSVFLWNAFGERRPRRWRDSRWRAFLSGYQQLRPLSPEALDVVPIFLAARQIWLMGVDCQNRGGLPIQWVNSRWLKEMIQPIQEWESQYPILRG